MIMNQELLDVVNKDSSSLFPWRGQFTPDFAFNMVRTFSSENSVLLDPFSGSGTSILAGIQQHLPSFGVELNPAAYLMSSTFELAMIPNKKRETILSPIQDMVNSCLFQQDVVSIILKSIHAEKNTQIKRLKSLLIVLLDVKKDKHFGYDEVASKWQQISTIVKSLPYSTKTVKSYQGDIRSVRKYTIKPNFIFTSPPYINVFNYHQNFRGSVEKLGINVLDTAKHEFGSNRRNRGNRFKTVTEYCVDMSLAIQTMISTLDTEGRIIFVVGRESKVLGIPFSNSNIIESIFTSIFHCRFLLHQERHFKNKFGTTIYEDILHFGYTKTDLPDLKTVLSMSYVLAKEVLVDAQHRAIHANISPDRIALLENALSHVTSVKPSPVKENKLNDK